MLPWTLKPLWSPFLEMFKTKKHFVVITQLVTGISFTLVALSLPLPDFFTYSIAFMGIIAFSGATHDIAGDGVYLTELSSSEQAKYIGWQGAFYNLAKILTNGALVYLAGELKNSIGVVEAWMSIMGICSLIMVCIGLYHIRILPSGGAAADTVFSTASPGGSVPGLCRKDVICFRIIKTTSQEEKNSPLLALGRIAYNKYKEERRDSYDRERSKGNELVLCLWQR